MTKDSFAAAVDDAPEEQRRLLQRMAELELVKGFGWDDRTKKSVIHYTPKGREFLRLVKAMSAPEPARRRARLLALDALAEDAIFISHE